ncbi:5-oxoprolinase subunit PxpA [Flagellimonas nanhaiensis]|uniref:LamB/YcsF family protein n=1 Tax=Flagellimonas nanhaiensis TaxID=2292706 RepID=A0A371JUE0_9FLAO|nr:5-oxoprolinase subunit PxpA [Allomuricauda nanhaiensis]RDY61420.1 LamB/YcsF family protein [Allomuricauda nanhaiensis]
MGTWSIDINCDVGEGVGNEAELFPLISSCNIACGGHAGDSQSMSEIIELATQNGVKIGVHPSYPDKKNFGREVMDISSMELQKSLSEQLVTFDEILKQQQGKLHHIKAHGALYNQTAKDLGLAKTYLDTVEQYNKVVLLYVPYGSVIAKEAKKRGFPVWYEAFADRSYNEDLSLVSRKQENALIKEPKKVLEHVLPMIKEGKVFATTGKPIQIQTETLCVHGDTASALEILTYLSQMLPKHKVQLRP